MAHTERRAWAWSGFCIVSAALSLTHYQSLWVLIALWGCVLVTPLVGGRMLPLRWLVSGGLLSLVLVLPWFAGGGLSALFGVASTSNKQMPPWFTASLGTFHAAATSFANARWAGLLAGAPTAAQVIAHVLYTVPALLAIGWALSSLVVQRRLERPQRAVMLLAIAVVLAVAGPIGMSLMGSGIPYDIRYTSPGIGFYCGLVAIGALHIRPARVRYAAIAGMLAFGLLSLQANYFIPYKENWRDALAWVAADAGDEDVTVFVPFEEPPLEWAVYHAPAPAPRHARINAVLTQEPAARRVWLLAYRRVEWSSAYPDAEAGLERRGYKLVEKRQYHWIDAAIWERDES